MKLRYVLMFNMLMNNTWNYHLTRTHKTFPIAYPHKWPNVTALCLLYRGGKSNDSFSLFLPWNLLSFFLPLYTCMCVYPLVAKLYSYQPASTVSIFVRQHFSTLAWWVLRGTMIVVFGHNLHFKRLWKKVRKHFCGVFKIEQICLCVSKVYMHKSQSHAFTSCHFCVFCSVSMMRNNKGNYLPHLQFQDKYCLMQENWTTLKAHLVKFFFSLSFIIVHHEKTKRKKEINFYYNYVSFFTTRVVCIEQTDRSPSNLYLNHPP